MGLDLLFRARTRRDGDHGPLRDVVLEVERAALVDHVLLGIGQPRSHAADIALHLLGRRGGAVFERALLGCDARALVGEADGVALVEDRDRGRDERRVDVVLDDFADDHERDGAALLVREARHLAGDLLEVGAHILGVDDDHARCCCRIVVDRDASRIAHEILEGGPRIAGVLLDEWIERMRHSNLLSTPFHPLLKTFRIMKEMNECFQHSKNTC